MLLSFWISFGIFWDFWYLEVTAEWDFTMDLAAVEVEKVEEEGMMVVTNVSMMNTMLGHIRLPGQEEEGLDLMMVETEEGKMSKYGDVRQQPGGSDILTGLFFSLLAFR